MSWVPKKEVKEMYDQMSVLKKEHTWFLHKARTTTMLTSEQQSKNNRRKTDADPTAPSDITKPNWHQMKFDGLGHVTRKARFSKSVEVGTRRPVILWTKVGITTTCREDTAFRDDPAAEAQSALGSNTISGPIHDARIALQYGRYGL